MELFNDLTKQMQALEQAINSKTRYINAVGEAKAGTDYMQQYYADLTAWNNLEAQRLTAYLQGTKRNQSTIK